MAAYANKHFRISGMYVHRLETPSTADTTILYNGRYACMYVCMYCECVYVAICRPRVHHALARTTCREQAQLANHNFCEVLILAIRKLANLILMHAYLIIQISKFKFQ
jgi:hypothetical protein